MDRGSREQRLAALRRGVARCRRCPLWRGATHAVAGEGNPNAAVMVVGEGPGRQEDLSGRPFVGRAGRLLEQLLAHAGLRREDVYITNVVKHRAATPGTPRRDRPPLSGEIGACRSWLLEQIEILRPRVIVTLGRHALAAFLPAAAIGDCHGRPQAHDICTILPLYHPSYALHNPGVRPLLFRDVAALRALAADRRAGGSSS
ncbi:MAG TPA: uracil-DNA glycosylase [bacterium]|nr:uracil-DNA glycosylase [bacterium]